MTPGRISGALPSRRRSARSTGPSSRLSRELLSFNYVDQRFARLACAQARGCRRSAASTRSLSDAHPERPTSSAVRGITVSSLSPGPRQIPTRHWRMAGFVTLLSIERWWLDEVFVCPVSNTRPAFQYSPGPGKPSGLPDAGSITTRRQSNVLPIRSQGRSATCRR
jgi:hypothetical protein